MNDVSAFWSGITVVVRLIAIHLFIYMAQSQYKLLKSGKGEPRLSPLLLGLFVIAILDNLPVLYLNFTRAIGDPASPELTAFATITNAVGWLITGVIFLIFKRYDNTSEK